MTRDLFVGADGVDAALEFASGHPYPDMPACTVEVHESRPLPGT